VRSGIAPLIFSGHCAGSHGTDGLGVASFRAPLENGDGRSLFLSIYPVVIYHSDYWARPVVYGETLYPLFWVLR